MIMKKNVKQTLTAALSMRLLSCVLFAAAILLASVTAFAQDKTIRGRITSETGSPVSGVSVQVKGTSNGTVTNDNGEYSINAAKGSVLVVSNVGFSNKEV